MGAYVYIVKEDDSGRVIGTYQTPGPTEPQIGTVFTLEGKQWRVKHWQRADRGESAGNVLRVELA